MSTPIEHQIPTDSGPVPGLLWFPDGRADGARVPGLVVFQEIFGVTEFVRSRCADLAELGYAVLAPAVYARLVEPGQEAPVIEAHEDDFLERSMGLVGELDWELAVRDGLAARDALAGVDGVDADRVGLVGFCFGGGLAFNVAAAAAQAGRPVAALVSYYGSALPNLLGLAEHVDCPSLHHFGTSDSYIPMEQVERIREAVTASGAREQVRFELHEGADHAFDNPHPMFHHAAASARAWEQTEAFLAEVLPT
ncbi:MAG TPA: dienelactone hydrolase family protein [Intrasporangiaceae bacterium]|nr:dienelactone hydrolase family protein [Intrasporangiaceae bacterium]